MENTSLKPARDEDFLYHQIAGRLTSQIHGLLLKTGDKLPSVRALSHEHGISISTAYKAYVQLEIQGLIEARPKSGYYVRYTPTRSFEVPKHQKKISDSEK